MSAVIDYTKPHPETVLWWERRRKCNVCANLRRGKGLTAGAMRCAAVLNREQYQYKQPHAYCIDARASLKACGHDARLFEPKESA